VARIRVPASTSNLGPGFDTLGLALSLYLDVDVEPCDDQSIAGSIVSVEGEGAADLPRTSDNMIHDAFRHAAEREGVAPPPVVFRVRNEIPVARGLGSSAAAVVAGLSAFAIASGREVSAERILEYGTEIEQHADNIAPSLFGGLLACCTRVGGPPVVVRSEWPAELGIVLVIPDIQLLTSEARRILPDSVPRADAIFNVQRAALFVTAIAEHRWDALGEAMRDRLHQPYRERLLPGLAEVLALEPTDGLVGVALSGAGSAVLALATDRHEQVGARVAACFETRGVAVTVRRLHADARGLAIEPG